MGKWIYKVNKLSQITGLYYGRNSDFLIPGNVGFPQLLCLFWMWMWNFLYWIQVMINWNNNGVQFRQTNMELGVHWGSGLRHISAPSRTWTFCVLYQIQGHHQPYSEHHLPATTLWSQGLPLYLCNHFGSQPILTYQHLYFFPDPTIVQLFSCVQLFATPWTAAHQTYLYFTISWSLLKLVSIKLVMSSNHPILMVPFSSCLQSFPE